MQGHLGVFTKENIKKRVIFGPFKGQAIPFEELNVGDNFMRLWEVSCCYYYFHDFAFQEKGKASTVMQCPVLQLQLFKKIS